MYPENEYLEIIEKKLENLDLKNTKKFNIVLIQKFLLVKLRH